MTDLLILEQKWSKSPVRQGNDDAFNLCNQQVGGSNPSTSSTPFQIEPASLGFDLVWAPTEYGGVPEWPKGADCKSVALRFGGSNPPSSTNLE